MRHLADQELRDLAFGAAVLGAGGGGDPYIGLLLATQAIREFGPVELVEPQDVPDDATIVSVAMMGAPTIMVEKLPAGDEVERAFDGVCDYLGRPITYLMSAEAGGMNSTIPIALAARRRIPLVDADLMGRAFPELQMCLPTMYGVSATPMAMADEKGNVAVIDTIGNLWTERLARSVVIEMGGSALISLYALTGRELKESSVWHSLTLCSRIGEAVRLVRESGGDPVGALLGAVSGFRLFEGSVRDVRRRTEGGFARAEIAIEGSGPDAGRECRVHSQNEHLVVLEGERVLASVPDIIVIADAAEGVPVTTEAIRYGFRIVLIGIPCDPRWRTEDGLAIVGPRYFGYDIDYIPVEELSAV